MSKTDILVQIKYNMSEPRGTVIRTNVKQDVVKDVLVAWLLDQVGGGLIRDLRGSDKKNEYNVSIKFDLIDGNFYISSDTGDSGLTVGIVAYVSQNLDKFQISSLK